MAIVEIVHWIGVKQIKDDNCKLLHQTLDVISKRKGCLGIHYGFLHGHHKTYVYCFIIWDKFEDHLAFKNDPAYPQILKLDECVGEGGINMNHVQFHADVHKALTAPVTEVSIMTLDPGTLKELLISHVDKVASVVDAMNEKYAPATWGQAREEQNRYYLIVGWDSVDVHKTTVHDPSLHPFDKDLKASVSLRTFHISLKTYKK